MIPVLVELDEMDYVIKKGSTYACISTNHIKFLDVVNYIAPGYNYDSFLKAFGANSSKSYWPYQWFTSLDKLDTTTFPDYTDFYSTLKLCNTLEPGNSELTDTEIELIGRVPTKDIPLTTTETVSIGQFRYHELCQMFDDNNWSMRELLEYYNNLDVQPFLEALDNLT